MRDIEHEPPIFPRPGVPLTEAYLPPPTAPNTMQPPTVAQQMPHMIQQQQPLAAPSMPSMPAVMPARLQNTAPVVYADHGNLRGSKQTTDWLREQAQIPEQAPAGPWTPFPPQQPAAGPAQPPMQPSPQGKSNKPIYTIPRKNTEKLYVFDNDPRQYKDWKMVMIDHMAEQWSKCRMLLQEVKTMGSKSSGIMCIA